MTLPSVDAKTGSVIMPAATRKKTQARKCAMCRKSFQARRSTARYCCQSCRQKAARLAKGSSPKTAARRRLKTKKATKLVKTCQHCQQPFETTAAAAKQVYCRPACRQASYRARRVLAVAALGIFATAEGYCAEAVRDYVSDWSLTRLTSALERVQTPFMGAWPAPAADAVISGSSRSSSR